QPLDNGVNYTFTIASGIKGFSGETFPGLEYTFITLAGKLTIQHIDLNGSVFSTSIVFQNIDPENINIQVAFSHPLDASNYKSYFSLSGNNELSMALSADEKVVTISPVNKLSAFTRYDFTISNNLKSKSGFPFAGFANSFYTKPDTTLKFPLISDEELLTLIQRQTFKYFYDFAHPSCGLARERNTSGDVVTMGGSGFGVMALIVGMERGFITRNEGLTRLGKILGFLETCDRFHGAWPHWLNGVTGKVVPFGQNDDGADLVETSFMIQGLLAMRQYLNPATPAENTIIGRINTLANSVEYDWFTQGGQNVLYWNWSPNSGWAVNVKLQGYNETLITYVLAASSTTHSIQAAAYKLGYSRNGAMRNGKTFYGYKLPLGEDYGGPLFFTHYSFLGLNPKNLQDEFANYWEQNVNQSLINQAYCIQNPLKYVGYSSSSWGLTASDNKDGYSAHSPTNDLGVITPTAAISSLPYTPTQSMDAIRHFYYILGDKLWGPYGFYDAFDVTHGWWASSYIAIDQGPQVCMIENYRTGLIWNLFMSAPEVQTGLTKLGFSYK
ncbi:MAG TPA: glucoamylase family protein, partial [Bacteroidales bacterium]